MNKKIATFYIIAKYVYWKFYVLAEKKLTLVQSISCRFILSKISKVFRFYNWWCLITNLIKKVLVFRICISAIITASFSSEVLQGYNNGSLISQLPHLATRNHCMCHQEKPFSFCFIYCCKINFFQINILRSLFNRPSYHNEENNIHKYCRKKY